MDGAKNNQVALRLLRRIPRSSRTDSYMDLVGGRFEVRIGLDSTEEIVILHWLFWFYLLQGSWRGLGMLMGLADY